ncbi:MAG: class I SAM-dependent methyltransferase [Burkholderia sp.]|uniref:class I SAM-dependent methyltransferase n=1 Tax=Burkholderia sp. TaxID=36773 RepID=UPI0028365DED|nr:class I SAM-dependent methyltransferase [Burkholderia sp.]MDR0244234.1 class I SAM-dependent methyltransferase [Burkholderia sp.]
MATTTFKDHFSGGSAGYAAYRPTYPAALIDFLASLAPARERALDCGCGTGQLSVLLADRFDEVVATDASAAQIGKAQPHDGVTYRTSLAEDSGLPDASVDLIAVAQAAHWLDLDKFYAEVRRVARRQAGIALVTYGVLHVEGAVDDAVLHFYYDTIGGYWPAERGHVEDGYRRLPFPFDEVVPPALAIDVQWCLDDLIGYLNTWSAVKAAEKALGANPVDALAETLRDAWGDPASRRRVTWPLSIRAGRVA